MLDLEFKATWLEALKSGKYTKGKGKLSRSNLNGMCYCCLGVAEIVCDIERCSPEYLDKAKAFEFGLSHEMQKKLALINDETETFDEVIKYIEEKL